MIRLTEHLPADPSRFATAAVTPVIAAMQGSLILQIAADVRALVAKGADICNLTVGDFDPKQFPIPAALKGEMDRALLEGATNYPPSEGIPELRSAIAAWSRRRLGIDATPEQIVVAAGARPVMYATYRMCLRPGDTLVYAVPSWNNGYYGQLCEARMVPLVTSEADNFFPTPEALAPLLRDARLFTLNSPLNPTGTVISPEQLDGIANVIVEENARRGREGREPLLWMWDQVYGELTFGAVHLHPCARVPAVSPYVITVDAISKCFAATGLRVGWAILHPALAERMKSFLGHVGAWAPRPTQLAVARLLVDEPACDAFLGTFREGLHGRLQALSDGLGAMGVPHLVPQGAMYLSVRFDLFGKPGVDGQPMKTNEDIRKWLLVKAGIAVVPFQAFDFMEDTGWFRMSVGAVSIASLQAGLERLKAALLIGE